MKFLLITRVPESIGRVLVKQEAERRGHQIDFWHNHTVGISKGELDSLVKKIQGYDVFHYAAGLGEAVISQVHKMLEGSGVFCVNDRSRIVPHPSNKLSQAVNFMQNGVSTPKTYRSDQPVYQDLAKLLGSTFVAKEPKGTKGKAVWLIRGEDDLSKIADGKEFLFQEYKESDGDYRVHVVGGDTPFCAYRRLNPPGDFRSNISQGGTASSVNDPLVTEKINGLAVQAAKAMGLDYCGVDIIQSNLDGQFYVLETNVDPGFKSVKEVAVDSFASVIVDYYERSVETTLA